ncbi:nucleotide-diphosphate-sugar epimerase [Longimycelium tulufanense]|uniref:Nucleotide-diphosphate-sugar epimerase n=1 Tax=Longimycelium tulufanense TaxID=907463 RepID=A0A8J3C873_9PSEU|nr:NAD(P)H-binding protein [Longimycelium tulufanense]GGM52717.1 nucleotide-diphosphate-sugar epimerase [Longimycelium tulufanense]
MTILVTGGRGHVARAVVQQLLDVGEKVRLASRNPTAVTAPDSVEVVGADLTRADSLIPALAGVSKVFLYADPAGIDNFVEAAQKADVEHVVLLSASPVTGANPGANPLAVMHKAAEQALLDSELSWTFLRPATFATNTLQWAYSIRTEGVVRAAYPEAYNDAIHEADIAAVAVRALTEDGHVGRAYLMTGPESVTQRQQVEAISAAIGRPVEFVELTPAEYRETLARWGGGLVDQLIRYLAENDGVPMPVINTVELVTGRPARTFDEWARDHADDFR